MRITLKAADPISQVLASGEGFILRVMSPGTVYISKDKRSLEPSDSTGIPKEGMAFQQTDPALVVPTLTGNMYGRTNEPLIEVEVITL